MCQLRFDASGHSSLPLAGGRPRAAGAALLLALLTSGCATGFIGAGGGSVPQVVSWSQSPPVVGESSAEFPLQIDISTLPDEAEKAYPTKVIQLNGGKATLGSFSLEAASQSAVRIVTKLDYDVTGICHGSIAKVGYTLTPSWGSSGLAVAVTPIPAGDSHTSTCGSEWFGWFKWIIEKVNGVVDQQLADHQAALQAAIDGVVSAFNGDLPTAWSRLGVAAKVGDVSELGVPGWIQAIPKRLWATPIVLKGLEAWSFSLGVKFVPTIVVAASAPPPIVVPFPGVATEATTHPGFSGRVRVSVPYDVIRAALTKVWSGHRFCPGLQVGCVVEVCAVRIGRWGEVTLSVQTGGLHGSIVVRARQDFHPQTLDLSFVDASGAATGIGSMYLPVALREASDGMRWAPQISKIDAISHAVGSRISDAFGRQFAVEVTSLRPATGPDELLIYDASVGCEVYVDISGSITPK